MSRMIVTVVVSIALGFGAGWAARSGHSAAQQENGDAIAGFVIGAVDSGVHQSLLKPVMGADISNIAKLTCDFRRIEAPHIPELQSEQQCTERVLARVKSFHDDLKETPAGRKNSPPPAGE